jgi:hypothetical protein
MSQCIHQTKVHCSVGVIIFFFLIIIIIFFFFSFFFLTLMEFSMVCCHFERATQLQCTALLSVVNDIEI